MVNLLQIVNGFAVGGGEAKLLELTRCLLDSKKYNIIVCSVGQGGPLQTEFEKLGVKVYVFPKKHKFDISLIGKVAKLMIRERIDIVQMTLFYAEIIGTIAAILARVKIKISWEVYTHSRKLRHLLAYKLIYKIIDVVVTVSENTKKAIISEGKVNPSKVTTIHYGVDLTKYNRLNGHSKRDELNLSNHRIVGVVARLTDQKGHSYLIEAAPQIVKEFPDVCFVFVGDGPLRQLLEDQVHSLGLESHFIFLGYRSDIKELLNSFDIFVLPSLFEGLPNVVLEAMACSKPVVATAVAGTPEAVIDGKTGYLVPSQNPEALAEALINLLEDEDLLEKMGREGRRRMETHFSLEGQISKFEALYEQLLT